MAVIEVGQQAPEFSLPVSWTDKVALSDYRGKKNVVLAFYVLDFTGGWERELISFQRDLARFEEKDAQVLSVSVDSAASHTAFAEKCGGFSFPMLSDFHPKGEVCRAYGVYNEERGVPVRSVFLIDEGGIVRYKKVYERGLPDNEEILAELDKMG